MRVSHSLTIQSFPTVYSCAFLAAASSIRSFGESSSNCFCQHQLFSTSSTRSDHRRCVDQCIWSVQIFRRNSDRLPERIYESAVWPPVHFNWKSYQILARYFLGRLLCRKKSVVLSNRSPMELVCKDWRMSPITAAKCFDAFESTLFAMDALCSVSEQPEVWHMGTEASKVYQSLGFKIVHDFCPKQSSCTHFGYFHKIIHANSQRKKSSMSATIINIQSLLLSQVSLQYSKTVGEGWEWWTTQILLWAPCFAWHVDSQEMEIANEFWHFLSSVENSESYRGLMYSASYRLAGDRCRVFRSPKLFQNIILELYHSNRSGETALFIPLLRYKSYIGNNRPIQCVIDTRLSLKWNFLSKRIFNILDRIDGLRPAFPTSPTTRGYMNYGIITPLPWLNQKSYQKVPSGSAMVFPIKGH